MSAGCQKELNFNADPTILTSRGNFVGAYPPVFYSVMGLLASHDIESSVLLMRTLTVLIFTALVTSLYILLPVRRRQALVWSWILTTVPLGLFIIASNNPSSWTTMGVGFGWIALLGYFETDIKTAGPGRKITLGAIFALCAFMAAGSRGDGALYSIVAIIAVGVLTFARTKRFLVEAILPVGVVIMCVAMYRFSRPIASVTGGINADSSNIFASIANNVLQVPSLWMGVLGKEWGLGWLDTSMPGIVWVGGLACLIGVGFIGLRGMNIRRLLVLVGGAAVLALLPAALLAASGDKIGSNLQPRYILPLVVIFVGVLMLSAGGKNKPLTLLQWVCVAATLSVTQLICLHIDMQRYISGIENQSVNLDSDVQWWWHLPLAPMAVWIVGTISYSALLIIVLHSLNRAPSKAVDDDSARTCSAVNVA